MEYVDINGISVAYTEPYSFINKLPGGVAFANLYCDVVTDKVNTLYELCSGPGFIGFTLLSKGLCDKVIFSDINPVAIECLLKTIEINDLGDKVKIFWSDGLKHIPYNIKSDLVVCNPPHHPELYDGCRELLQVDLNWELHKNYYKNLHKILNKNGHSLILENSSIGKADGMNEGPGSKISDFFEMIEQNLKIKLVNTFKSQLESKYYFIDVTLENNNE